VKIARGSKGTLAQYDPQRAVKQIDALGGVIKAYGRAKDAKKVREAVEDKLARQCEFAAWWDAQEKDPGEPGPGRGKKKNPVLDRRRGFPRLGRDGLPDKQTVSKWRRLLDPKKYEEIAERTITRAIKIVEFETTAHVGHNSGENEWYTPKEYIEAARAVLGEIDLDPASSDAANRVVKAAQIFSAEESGLPERWDGRVWMNPPYSQPLITQFCEKLAESVRAGTVTAACVLVNNATETQWFRAIAEVASAICFPTGRVRFWQPGKESAAPLQGQAVVYVGPSVANFAENFSGFGLVWFAQIKSP